MSNIEKLMSRSKKTETRQFRFYPEHMDFIENFSNKYFGGNKNKSIDLILEFIMLPKVNKALEGYAKKIGEE